MKINRARIVVACLCAAAAASPAAFAQQQTNPSDQYQGVSQPPPDDTIVASPDTPAPAEQPASATKPSPTVAQTAAPASTVPAPVISHGNTNSSAYDNTDFGIVTAPSQQNQSSAAPAQDAVLHTRQSYNPDADIVDVVLPANELPQGSEIAVRMSTSLSTSQTTEGTAFQGQVMHDILHEGRVIIPAGSTLRGRVVRVSQGHHFGPAATLRLRPDVVILPDGTAYHLYAQVMSTEANSTRTDSEGGIQPSSHIVKKTLEYGVGVGTGAMVGGELAGPPGALAGSLVGAGLVATHLLLQHPEAAVVPAGSEIVFYLTEPMEMTPTRN
jgi:hypothetical protein